MGDGGAVVAVEALGPGPALDFVRPVERLRRILVWEGSLVHPIGGLDAAASLSAAGSAVNAWARALALSSPVLEILVIAPEPSELDGQVIGAVAAVTGEA